MPWCFLLDLQKGYIERALRPLQPRKLVWMQRYDRNPSMHPMLALTDRVADNCLAHRHDDHDERDLWKACAGQMLPKRIRYGWFLYKKPVDGHDLCFWFRTHVPAFCAGDVLCYVACCRDIQGLHSARDCNSQFPLLLFLLMTYTNQHMRYNILIK